MFLNDRERVSSENTFPARKFDVLKTKRGSRYLGLERTPNHRLTNSTQRKTTTSGSSCVSGLVSVDKRTKKLDKRAEEAKQRSGGCLVMFCYQRRWRRLVKKGVHSACSILVAGQRHVTHENSLPVYETLPCNSIPEPDTLTRSRLGVG